MSKACVPISIRRRAANLARFGATLVLVSFLLLGLIAWPQITTDVDALIAIVLYHLIIGVTVPLACYVGPILMWKISGYAFDDEA